MKIIYLHRLDLNNPGDLWSTPEKYLPIEGNVYDIAAPPVKESCDLLIVGGGGIINQKEPWSSRLEGWMDSVSFGRAVIWGAGVEAKSARMPALSRFDLIGARNVDSGAAFFVPCISCLHTIFDEAPAGRGVGIISHKKRSISTEGIVNAPNDIETVVNYIKQHAVIVTASYHAAYWATLLGRKVYVFDSPGYEKKNLPQKMLTFERQPEIITDLSAVDPSPPPKKAPADGEPLLFRYRRLNREFSASVFALVGMASPI